LFSLCPGALLVAALGHGSPRPDRETSTSCLHHRRGGVKGLVLPLSHTPSSLLP